MSVGYNQQNHAITSNMTVNKRLYAIDLFSGAGGLSLGMEEAGISIVLANEIEPDFAKTHELNHVNTKLINRDIYQVDFSAELRALRMSEKIDIVCGGPPCQGFSTVGKKEFTDPRNSLFAQFLRAVDEVRPRFVLFENVAGFKRMYKGEIYKVLIEELESRGFNTISSVLNAKNYGLPQSRERTIVLGWLHGENPIEFPQITHGDKSSITRLTPYLTLMDAISDLPKLTPGGAQQFYASAPHNDYQQKLRVGTKNLTEHNCANYGDKMRVVLELIPPGGSVLDLPLELRPKSYFHNTYARLHPDVPSPTITRNFGTPSSSRCVHPYQNRALSTREGARLQGFPDAYVFFGAKGSKNLQIGNAVPPIFGEILAKQIMKSVSQP